MQYCVSSGYFSSPICTERSGSCGSWCGPVGCSLSRFGVGACLNRLTASSGKQFAARIRNSFGQLSRGARSLSPTRFARCCWNAACLIQKPSLNRDGIHSERPRIGGQSCSARAIDPLSKVYSHQTVNESGVRLSQACDKRAFDRFAPTSYTEQRVDQWYQLRDHAPPARSAR